MTRQKTIDRWGGHGQGYKRQKNVYSLIKKFGWDNIIHTIVKQGLSQEEARDLEQALIRKNKLNGISVNLSDGGDVGSDQIPMFEVNGQMLTSSEVAALSDVDGLTSHDITNRINEHGWSLDKALTKKKIPKNKKYEYNGKYYTTKELLEMNEDPNLNIQNLSSRINHHGWSVERAITQKHGTHKVSRGIGDRIYEYNGKMYNSYELVQISNVEGLEIGHITNRINHHGWSVERAITTPLKQRDLIFNYKGKNYNSYELAEISVSPNMTHHDVTDRYHNGWSVWEIVNIPKGMTRKRFYKTQ